MEPIVLMSLPVSDLKSLVMDCMNTCLQHSPTTSANATIEKPIGGPEAAADFLELEVPTIYSLVQAKKIPFHKPSKKIYFYASELNEWVRSGKGKTLAELKEEAENDTVEANKRKRA